MNYIRSFWNSPTGLRSTHFWGPTFNWSLPLAAAMDMKNPAETISGKMTGVMCVYSALFMRFAWVIRPITHIFFCAMPPMRRCNCISFQGGSELKGTLPTTKRKRIQSEKYLTSFL
ncbi:unnamed protein product [Sphenostylis stenocarpa]|uniref:Mitochondrial pyruvate carrier n=1 Tax=Sphenostylis stenocarpa TaxID=92480 RepID=A0AA86RP18_9FABA|nr:unnamed protein product [Sphenostylis stenocarpa]